MELNVSKWWICGGSQITEKWPCRGEGLEVAQILKWNWTRITRPKEQPEGWVLTGTVIGQEYIARKGKAFNTIVVETPVKECIPHTLLKISGGHKDLKDI